MDNIAIDRDNLRKFLEEAELQQYYELFRDILKVSKLSQLKYVAIEDLAQIGLSRPEQRRFKKIYSKFFPNSYLSKIKKFLQVNKRNDENKRGHIYIPIDPQSFSDINVKVPTKHIISIEDITINKELGMGQFGVVQQGIWTTGNQRLQVAIKCLGNERMTSNSPEFLKEAAVMHSVDHPHIVRLYGVVLHLDSLMLVTELAPLRSLLECLWEVSLRSEFSVDVLCKFAEQICDGMSYLENKRLLHRDLAARNILVFNKDIVKISDFGLSRALGVGKDYYQTNYNVNLKLPVAWCAPECILYLKFTSMNDVWAFAVCLWEMFSYGFQPWAAFSGQQILEAIDAPNFQRLERPDCCPDAYYSLMLECWSHDPAARPSFHEMRPKLRQIKPDEVQAVVSYKKPEDGRRSNFLEYKVGQRIIVLGKESFTKSAMWYGALPGGACGYFEPNHMRPYINEERGFVAGSLSPHPNRNSSRSIRSSLLRTDVKRHTFTGKRTIERSMISSPQGDVKHTGHVGLDGAYFGDLSFLDSAGCVVSPYKPSEDLEEVPLINPNSPSHLTMTTSTTVYPLLNSNKPKCDCDEVDLSYDDGRPKSSKKPHRTGAEATSKSLLSKVKSATLGRSHKSADYTKNEEVHEYHEISDTDTESIPAEMRAELPESPGIRGFADFSQSLLDEMETIFRSLDNPREEDVRTKQSEIEAALRAHTLSKKKGFSGTMKPMSAHDEKTLNTAVALANEITSKSMTDLEKDQKPLTSPTERSKFTFKFPLVSALHHGPQNDAETKEGADKAERRNFSEEAKSVPDIQATITKESKQAYESLIEKPTPSSLISQMAQDVSEVASNATETNAKVCTIPKPLPRQKIGQFNSLPKPIPYHMRSASEEITKAIENNPEENINVIPLPPRGTKPKLVDKPRHYRKYPLRLPPEPVSIELQKVQEEPPKGKQVIYQNTVSCSIPIRKVEVRARLQEVPSNGIDVFDGPEPIRAPTNPFTSVSDSTEMASAGSVNPFKCYLEEDTFENPTHDFKDAESVEKNFKTLSLTKDHVSVEDLLEFADLKPSARQRGVESDEVRIMNKVLKQQVTPEECLHALELSDWNVHIAIKVLRVKILVDGTIGVSLEDCHRELQAAEADVVKAYNVLVLCNKENKN